jgi:hypothetical protein
MGGRSRTGVAVLLLASFCILVVTPPTFAQVETVGDFVVKLARAAGLAPSSAADAIVGLVRKKVLSKSLGDSLASQTALPLTKGLAARILVDALRDTKLGSAATQDQVDALAQRGIMAAGPADVIVTEEEATAVLTNPAVAAAMSAAAKPAAGHFSPALLAILAVAAAAAGGHGGGGGGGGSFTPASP